MAYSRNLQTLEARLPWLEPLASGKEVRWSVPTGTERLFAYRMREALWIAANLAATEHPALARAHHAYRLTPGAACVIATLRPDAEPTLTAEAPPPETQTPEPNSPAPPTSEAADSIIKEAFGEAKPITQRGAITLIQIVELIRTRGRRGLPYHFPEAGLPVGEVRTLLKWLDNQPEGYLLFYAPPGLTIKAHTEDLAPYSTTMEDL